MKSLLIIVLVLSILITSCTVSKMINKENQTEFYHEIYEACQDRKVEMWLINGQRIKVYMYNVSGDSTVWQDVKYYTKRSISPREIAVITPVKDSGVRERNIIL